MEQDAVFAVLPFRVAVTQLLEPEALETSGQGQFAEPAVDGDVHAIGAESPITKQTFAPERVTRRNDFQTCARS